MHNGQFLSKETASTFHYWKQKSTSLPKILTRTLDNNNCGGKSKPQKEHTLSQSLNLTCSMQQCRLLGELNYTFNGDVFGASHSLRYWNLLGTSTSDIGVLAVSMVFFRWFHWFIVLLWLSVTKHWVLYLHNLWCKMNANINRNKLICARIYTFDMWKKARTQKQIVFRLLFLAWKNTAAGNAVQMFKLFYYRAECKFLVLGSWRNQGSSISNVYCNVLL